MHPDVQRFDENFQNVEMLTNCKNFGYEKHEALLLLYQTINQSMP